MRRGKKTSIPASKIVPALRTRSATKEPETACDTRPVGSSVAGASSQGDPFRPPRPASKPPAAKADERPSDSESAPALRPETNEEPALRTRSATKAPETPSDARPVGSSAADASSQGDPFQAPRPASKPPAAKADERPSDSEPAPALRPETNEVAPPLLPSQHRVKRGQWARGLASEAGKMFNVFRSIPTQMDYKGQKLAEQIFQGIILVSAVIGFIYGYITEQFGWTVYIVMAGFALSCLLTLPPWPIYRRNPLKWLPVQESATDDKKPADRKVKRHPKN